MFARVTDFLYAGRDTELTITCEHGGEIAVPSASCDHRLPARYGAAEDVASRSAAPGRRPARSRTSAARRRGRTPTG